MRRLAVTNHSDRPREIEVTSYAEIVLAPPADDLAHPAFGKLFVETEYLPESAALLCRRRPRADGRAGSLGGPRPEPRRPDAGARGMGDRPRALPRPRARPRRPAGPRRALPLRHDRRRARPRRQPAAAHPPRAGRLREAVVRHGDGVVPRDGRRPRPALPRAERHGADLRPGLRARAERPAPPRHLERGGAALRAPGLAGAVRRRIAPRAPRASWPGTPSARKASGRTASRATCRSSSCGSSRRTTCRSCARSCRRRSTGGSRASAPTS